MITILQGDALKILKDLPDKHVQCVVTSPPYWGLRDYGTPDQLGLEKTPEEYVNHLVEIFREIKRVLRDDGTVWLNLGDCYNGSGGAGGDYNKGGIREGQAKYPGRNIKELKPKDLVGIPWRVAFALQADGWWLRRDIIWDKPNPSPESARDRPSTSHEYIFLLTKSKNYFYDQEAIRMPSEHGTGRNAQSVWRIRRGNYRGAHFATFPPELPERCILAGTSEKGCCPICGSPHKRVIQKIRPDDWKDSGPTTEHEIELRKMSKELYKGNQKSRTISDIYGRATRSRIETIGWEPTCTCGEKRIIPCVVLDPFAGSGTTGEVAKRLGRDAILIELNPKYEKLIRERTA